MSPYLIVMALFFFGYIGLVHTDGRVLTAGNKLSLRIFRIGVIVCNVFILAFMQIPRIRREISQNQMARINVLGGLISFEVPYFLSKFSNIVKLATNICLLLAFASDGIVADELGDWMGAKVTRQFHSWNVGLCCIMFTSMLLDMYALNRTTAAFRLQLFLVTPDLLPFVGVCGILLLAYACGLSLEARTLSMGGEYDYSHMNSYEINEVLAFSSVVKCFKKLVGLAVSCLQFDWGHDLGQAAQVYYILFVIFMLFGVVNLMTSTVAAASFAVDKEIEALVFRERARDIIEIESLVRLDYREKIWWENGFDQRVEFDEGDLGFAGGIQVEENVMARTYTTDRIDRILRFSGEASPEKPWPERTTASEDNRQLRVEGLLTSLEHKFKGVYKVLKTLVKKSKHLADTMADHKATSSDQDLDSS